MQSNCDLTQKKSAVVILDEITTVFIFALKLLNMKRDVNVMNEFKSYHPIVNFIYFLFVAGFSMFFMHPICLGISFVCAFAYLLVLKGRNALKKNLIYMLPMMLVTAIMNPIFNHEGITVLMYLPSGNPLTFESILYGISASVVLVSVICWFSCYNEVMTSDKFIYLFGRIIPSLSLVLSMTLRFVPKFVSQLRQVSNAQKCIGRDVSNGGIIQRAKNGLSVLSVMVTWALESSIETADSMKARGYGLAGRSAFSIFTFDKRDGFTLVTIAVLGIYVLIGFVLGTADFGYFPYILGAETSAYSMSVFVAYFALCIIPVVIELREVRRWKPTK